MIRDFDSFPYFGGALSGVIRANRFARFARIGNSSDSGESA